MRQRKKKVARVSNTAASIDRIARVSTKQKKADLIDLIVKIARADHKIMRQLKLQYNVETPPKELIAETRQAILIATDFDERETNYNFDYDYQAYETVKRNFKKLIALGQLREVMKLALELMKQGSYQVEMSDEGLMTDDIEACLQVVIRALKKSKLPNNDVIAWCEAMIKNDRVDFICNTELQALRKRFESL